MITKEELQTILQSSFTETLKGDFSVIFIDTADQHFVAELFSSHSHFVNNTSPSTVIITESFSETDNVSPYYPFLKILKNLLLGKPTKEIDEIIRQSGVYSYHHDIFLNYFSEKSLLRIEEVIFEEIQFERKRFLTDILSLLLNLSGEGILLQISNLERLTSSSAEFIWQLQDHCVGQKIQCVFSMNISGISANDAAPEFLKRFSNDIFSVYSVFEIDGEKLLWQQKESLTFKESSFSVESAVELLNFLCIEESATLAVRLYDGMIENPSLQTDNALLLVLNIATFSYLYQNELDIALYYANLFINQSRISDDPVWRARAARLTSMLYYFKGDIDNSSRHAYQSLQHAAYADSPVDRALANFVLFLCKDTTNTVFAKPDAYSSLYENMIILFEEVNFTDHLAYVYSRSIYLMFLYRTKGEPAALKTCDKGIALSSESGNEFRLSVAYQAQGLLMQMSRRNKLAIDAYLKAKEIKEKIGSPIEKARVYNSIGYYHFFNEEYSSALEYYFQALDLLEKNNQYEEICTTLVNIAFIYLFCFRYDECIHYLEESFRIMNYLNINDLPYHPRFFMYSILGMAYLKKKRISKALELLNRINTHRRVSIITRYEYYKFFLAEIERFNGNIADASRLYEETIENAREIEAETKHIMLLCFFEYGMMFQEIDQKDEARIIFSRGLQEISTNSSYPVYRELLTSARNGVMSSIFPELPFRKFDSSVILHSVKLDATLNTLHRKIMEINFLNSLQSALFSSSDVNEIIKKSGDLIDKTSIGTFCIFGMNKIGETFDDDTSRESYTIEYSSSPVDDNQKIFLKEILLPRFTVEELIVVENEAVLDLTPFGKIYYILHIPLEKQGRSLGFILLLSCKKDVIITSDDVRPLSIAAKQIATALELKYATDRLVRAATIDSLTGVYNRQELHRKIEIERQRVFRYNNQNKNKFSVLFIDLDNFKYYNDTYGHHVGDEILKYFIKLLESSVRTVDVIGRLGGDEFILMLPETTIEASTVIAQRILDNIQDQTELFSRIKKMLVSEDFQTAPCFGCSIGITEYDPFTNSSVDELLDKADKALYDAKRSGKNCYRLSD